MKSLLGLSFPFLLMAATAGAQGLSSPATPGAAMPGGTMAPSTGIAGAMPVPSMAPASPMAPTAAAPGMVPTMAPAMAPTMAPSAPPANAVRSSSSSPSTAAVIGVDGAIVSHHGKIYQTAKAGEPSQGFFTIENQGDSTDTLTAATCSIADQTALVGADGKPAAPIDIGSGKSVTLATNGTHIALKGTHFPIFAGSTVPCALTFTKAGLVQIMLYVVPAPAAAGAAGP